MRFKTLKLSSSTGTSRSQLLVFALFFAIIGGYFIYSSFAVGPSVWVSTTGNDSTCVRGDNAKPCKSFDRAYAIAQLGDTVEVAGGDYGDQTLTLKSDKSAVGDLADVVFQPAPSATVTIGELNSGTDVQSPNGAKHVTIKNMSDNNIGSKYCTWGITNGSEDMSIINGDACNVNVFDSKSITINGGD